MDVLKQQLLQKLVGNTLVNKCANCPALIFRDAWCTQERVIRFTTPFFRGLFDVKPGETGHWQTGDFVMYEVNNLPDSLVVDCVLSTEVGADKASVKASLLNKCGVAESPRSNVAILKTWTLSAPDGDVNKLFELFDQLLAQWIPEFERSLQKTDSSGFVEGVIKPVKLTRYERNKKARAACLAAHGTACAVCGIDFGQIYGPAFAGQIEVHHIVPLSTIGAEYMVDPVNDLVPVCPNCHSALHSKPGGVYTVEELRKMMKKES